MFVVCVFLFAPIVLIFFPSLLLQPSHDSIFNGIVSLTSKMYINVFILHGQ